MHYRCPVCKYVFNGNRDMANHIANNCECSENHQEWVESHGISQKALVTVEKGRLGQGKYQPLMDIINKECKLTE